MRKANLATLLLVSTLGWAQPAAADPVELGSPSFLSLHYGDPIEFVFYGPFGKFTGEIGPLDSVPGGACRPCAPGTIIEMDARLGPGMLGTGYWDPEPDPGTPEGATDVFWSGFLHFDTGGRTVAAKAGIHPDQESPFVFTGELRGYLDAAGTGSPVVQASLTGTGMLRFNLIDFGDFGLTRGELWINSTVFQFDAAQDPVPEPATMLLAGAGLAYIGRRARRASGRSFGAEVKRG